MRSDAALTEGNAVTVSIRPEDVHLSDEPMDGAADDNACVGTIEVKAFLGECIDVRLKVGDHSFLARAHPNLRGRVGEPIHIRMRPEKCIAIADGPSSSGAI